MEIVGNIRKQKMDIDKVIGLAFDIVWCAIIGSEGTH